LANYCGQTILYTSMNLLMDAESSPSTGINSSQYSRILLFIRLGYRTVVIFRPATIQSFKCHGPGLSPIVYHLTRYPLLYCHLSTLYTLFPHLTTIWYP